MGVGRGVQALTEGRDQPHEGRQRGRGIIDLQS